MAWNFATAKPDGGALVAAAAPEPVTVVDGTESSNNDPSTSAALSTSRLYLSYLTSAADVDYYRVPVPVAGTRVTFHLSHLPVDSRSAHRITAAGGRRFAPRRI